MPVTCNCFNTTFGAPGKQRAGRLTFPDGESEQTFTVTLLDDPGAECSETFTIRLQNGVGVATLGEPSTTTVTILDNETASFIYLPLVQR